MIVKLHEFSNALMALAGTVSQPQCQPKALSAVWISQLSPAQDWACHVDAVPDALSCMHLQVTCDRWDNFQGLQALTHLTELTISIWKYLPEVPESLRQLTQLQRLSLLETGNKKSDVDFRIDPVSNAIFHQAFHLCSVFGLKLRSFYALPACCLLSVSSGLSRDPS